MLITCVLVSHDKPFYCKQAIDSVLKQSYLGWRLVVMDSGVLADQDYFQWDDERVKVVRTGETEDIRKTLAMAPWCFNEAYRRGLIEDGLVVYLCDDDLWYEDAFATFAEWFHPRWDACYASQDYGIDRPPGTTTITGERRALEIRGRCAYGYPLDCHVDYAQLCIRRCVLERCQWPEERVTQTHADGVFMERIGALTPIYPVPVKVSLNRRTSQSTYCPC